jgi:hypothetical protein
VILSAGIGALVRGILTTLSEASTAVHDFLEFYANVGPLSGKTIISSATFFGAWGLLAAFWRRSSPPLRPVVLASVVLVILGLIGTFPIFFQAFASE